MDDASTGQRVAAISCGGRVRSQPDAHRRAGRLATAVTDAGIVRGDRVAIMARNDIEFLETSLAVAALGANPVPINTRWQAPEVGHVLADSGARLVVAHTEFVATVESAIEAVESDATLLEVVMPAELLGAAGLPADLARPTGRHPLLDEWIGVHPDPLGHIDGAVADSMGLIYTSGTTGNPKGVLRECMTPQQLLSIAAGTVTRMGLEPGGRMLVAGPLYHASPNAVAVLALRMGTDITIMPKWNAEAFLRHIERGRIQHAKVVPTMLSRLLSLPADVRAAYDVSSLTHLVHSAAPCPPSVKRAAIEWFGEAVREFYGCTEAGPITWIGAEEWLAHPGSVGRPADGSAVMIAAADGAELTTGEIGRVLVRGAEYWPRFTYLNQDNLDRPDAMIDVGDLGRLDEDGYLYLTGRSSEVVIAGGVNIYPAEVEAAIMAIAGVEDVAVFGIPDNTGDLGEAVAAHVVARPGVALAEPDILVGLRRQLADYKHPAVIHIVDQLPRDDSGKLYRSKLRPAPVPPAR